MTSALRDAWRAFAATLTGLNLWLGYLAGVLVAVSAVLLTAEVLARYIFNAPSDWGLELCILMLIAATFMAAGHTLAAKAHVNIDIVDHLMSGNLNRWRLLLADAGAAGLCGFVAVNAWRLTGIAWSEDWVSNSTWGPKLWIPFSLIALGMSLLALQYLVQIIDGRLAPMLAGGVMGVLEIGILYLGAALLLLFSGMPIAFALGGVALAFMYFFMPASNLENIAETLYSELNNFTLLTIPLFILMGAAIGKTHAAADLYEAAHRWLYKLPGSLGVANVFGCSVFAAMCGSSPATCAAIGGMGIPEMRKRGYSAELASGLIAAGGTLGILIPPSLTLIIYGIITEQSIGKLFIAGVIPGMLLALIFALWVMYAASREVAAARAGKAASELLQAEFFTWRQRMETLPRLLPFAVLIAVVMIALYGGWGTPSEVAGVGAAGSLVLVVFIYGVWRWRDMKEILLGTARESCMIMMIIAMAFLFTYVMSYLHITQTLAQWLVGLGLSKWAYLLWVNILLLVLGCFLPPVAIILMVTPVIMPGILAAGFDPIWFGIILTINMEMGLITPPVGLNLFVINGIAPDITFRQIMRGVMPFIWIMGAYIVLLSIFPDIVMWLPENVK